MIYVAKPFGINVEPIKDTDEFEVVGKGLKITKAELDRCFIPVHKASNSPDPGRPPLFTSTEKPKVQQHKRSDTPAA